MREAKGDRLRYVYCILCESTVHLHADGSVDQSGWLRRTQYSHTSLTDTMIDSSAANLLANFDDFSSISHSSVKLMISHRDNNLSARTRPVAIVILSVCQTCSLVLLGACLRHSFGSLYATRWLEYAIGREY